MSLEKIISELEIRISILEDENASLWGMLDELKNSDVKNFQKALQEAHDQLALNRILLKMPVDGEIN
tara:strand:- start:1340 stop:1540 length:201 start_codon:yes stop_codon:yes gene_type:complete